MCVCVCVYTLIFKIHLILILVLDFAFYSPLNVNKTQNVLVFGSFALNIILNIL